MLPLRYARRWRLAGWFILATGLAAAMMPAFWSEQSADIPNFDKWLHAVAFCLLAIWYCGQYARNTFVWIACGLVVYGALIEMGQALVPYRTAEWGDLLADCLGIALGIIIAVLGAGGWSQRAENWLDNRID